MVKKPLNHHSPIGFCWVIIRIMEINNFKKKFFPSFFRNNICMLWALKWTLQYNILEILFSRQLERENDGIRQYDVLVMLFE